MCVFSFGMHCVASSATLSVASNAVDIFEDGREHYWHLKTVHIAFTAKIVIKNSHWSLNFLFILSTCKLKINKICNEKLNCKNCINCINCIMLMAKKWTREHLCRQQLNRRTNFGEQKSVNRSELTKAIQNKIKSNRIKQIKQ